MANTERVTVTLPTEMVERIDQLERNRSRFITEAVVHELMRRRRDGLLRSLSRPHPETAELERLGMPDWEAGQPPEDAALLDTSGGVAVRWVEGTGWVKDPE